MSVEKSSALLLCLFFCKHALGSGGVLSSELVKASQLGSAWQGSPAQAGPPWAWASISVPVREATRGFVLG